MTDIATIELRYARCRGELDRLLQVQQQMREEILALKQERSELGQLVEALTGTQTELRKALDSSEIRAQKLQHRVLKYKWACKKGNAMYYAREWKKAKSNLPL